MVSIASMAATVSIAIKNRKGGVSAPFPVFFSWCFYFIE